MVAFFFLCTRYFLAVYTLVDFRYPDRKKMHVSNHSRSRFVLLEWKLPEYDVSPLLYQRSGLTRHGIPLSSPGLSHLPSITTQPRTMTPHVHGPRSRELDARPLASSGQFHVEI